MRLLQPRQRVNSPEGSDSRQKGTLTLKSTYLKWPVQRTTRNNHLGLALQPSYSSRPTLTPQMFFTLLPPLPISARLLVTIFPFVLATALLLSDSAVFIFTPPLHLILRHVLMLLPTPDKYNLQSRNPATLYISRLSSFNLFNVPTRSTVLYQQ